MFDIKQVRFVVSARKTALTVLTLTVNAAIGGAQPVKAQDTPTPVGAGMLTTAVALWRAQRTTLASMTSLPTACAYAPSFEFHACASISRRMAARVCLNFSIEKPRIRPHSYISIKRSSVTQHISRECV